MQQTNHEKKLIILLDSGDTIVDEGTEERDEQGIVTKANLIPGAKEMIQTLVKQGYTLALVADGDAQSFKNVFTQNGIYDDFTTMIYSETIKVRKPNSRMFKAAIGALDLTMDDCYRLIMVGNNLARDIKGANALGITSVFLDWTPRYPKEPADASEKPDYTISMPLELVELAEKLNSELTSS